MLEGFGLTDYEDAHVGESNYRDKTCNMSAHVCMDNKYISHTYFYIGSICFVEISIGRINYTDRGQLVMY